MKYLARVIVLLTALPVHEFAHAFVASKCGDDTAYYSGRVSLNPMDHIDPLGAIMIVFFGFGFAKPVPVNSMRFYNRKKGMCLTSLAGPFSNILLAWLCVVLYKLFVALYYSVLPLKIIYGGINVLGIMASTNISLAVFNLLPIPPLDGYHAIMPFLPYEWQYKISFYEQKLVYAVMLLVYLGLFDGFMNRLTNVIYSFIEFTTGFMNILIEVLA